MKTAQQLVTEFRRCGYAVTKCGIVEIALCAPIGEHARVEITWPSIGAQPVIEAATFAAAMARAVSLALETELILSAEVSA